MERSKQPREEPTHGGDQVIIREEFDWSEVPPSTAVAETVATKIDRDSTQVAPLYDYVDTDALNQLVARGETEGDEVEVTVAFEYGDLRVAVHDTGLVVVQPAAPV